MINMTEFEEIIKLRNKGYTQNTISKAIGVSERTVQRYLSSGKIPVYKRSKSTREDPFEDYREEVEKILLDKDREIKPKSSDIFRHISKKGYKGSKRTVSRKTYELRQHIRSKEIYFEQSVEKGKMMEGDFTNFEVPFVTGNETRHLWVMSLKNSCGTYASSFTNQTFESFAEGSVNGFEYFGGVSEIYRLDNLKPVVKKILRNIRVTTSKFNEFIKHYGFKPSFCSPAKGNEKGTVESINRHFKEFLKQEMSLENKKFENDNEWEEYIQRKLELFNSSKSNKIAEEKKLLKPLPNSDFPLFTTEIHKVNKYGFISLAATRYSIPHEYIHRSIEVRLFSKKIEFYCNGKKIKEHVRKIYRRNRKSEIDFRDHVEAMMRKPGAFNFYKYKEAFFPSDIFKEFYNSYSDNTNYLSCLALCKSYSIQEIESCIKLMLNKKICPSPEGIIKILDPEIIIEKHCFNSLKPLEPSLDDYDDILLTTERKGFEPCEQLLH